MKLLQSFYKHVLSRPDMIAFEDETPQGKLTFRQLEELSGSIYAYLTERKIGKEDIVLLYLPRSVKMIAAMLGVIKAGAVFLPIEEGYPADRMEYIIKDCAPKLIFDSDAWEQAISAEYKQGNAEPSLHDAAFIVYTSGSTGNPKGVVQEYGVYERYMQNNDAFAREYWANAPDGWQTARTRERDAFIAPFFFLAGVGTTMTYLYQGCYVCILSADTYKNFDKFKNLLIQKKITSAVMTPAYLQRMGDVCTEDLELVYIGAERACHLYNDRVKYLNSYGSSESGYDIAGFLIDRDYAVTPVGKPYADTGVELLDEYGTPVPQGEEGEITLRNHWFRGYVNQPELTKEVLRGGVLHMGDLGKFLPDGNLVVLGRLDDMIKINGNRVEPGEIEAALRKALSIDWVHVQAFFENDRSLLCAYYTADIVIDREKLTEELSGQLPYFMIPAFYIKLDEIPRILNGKVDRRAFHPPVFSDGEVPYAAPRNDEEKRLCDAFGAVLGKQKVSIYDDFFDLGGDSLRAMEVLTRCNFSQLQLQQIYRFRTPEKIVAAYLKSKDEQTEDFVKRNSSALQKEWQLLPSPDFYVREQLKHPDALEYNLFSLTRLGLTINPWRLKKALERIVRSHPVFLTTIHKKTDGSFFQKYTPEVEKPLTVEIMSDRNLMAIKDTLPVAFEVIGGRLYDFRIFLTQKGTYLFINLHHIITDGHSMVQMLKEISDAYSGHALKPDYYYLTLEEYGKLRKGTQYETVHKQFEQLYKGKKPTHLCREQTLPEGKELTVFCPVPVNNARLAAFQRENALTHAEFFQGVCALAQAAVSHLSDVVYAWVYNGRDQQYMQDVLGCLITHFVAFFHLRREMTVREFYDDLKKQSYFSLENSFCPYGPEMLPGLKEAVLYIYQGDIFDSGINSKLKTTDIPIKIQQRAGNNLMEFGVLNGQRGIELMIRYNDGVFAAETANKLASAFSDICNAILQSGASGEDTLQNVFDSIGLNFSDLQ